MKRSGSRRTPAAVSPLLTLLKFADKRPPVTVTAETGSRGSRRDIPGRLSIVYDVGERGSIPLPPPNLFLGRKGITLSPESALKVWTL